MRRVRIALHSYMEYCQAANFAKKNVVTDNVGHERNVGHVERARNHWVGHPAAGPPEAGRKGRWPDGRRGAPNLERVCLNGQPQSRRGLISGSLPFLPSLHLLHVLPPPPPMELSAAGGHTPPRPSAASGGASPSPPPPPPPPPRGWLAGLVSGAGRILAAVLGPEPSASSSVSGSGSIASDAASDGGSPTASCSPAPCRVPAPRGEGHNGGCGTGTRLLKLCFVA
jgi:hypothetical protein